KIINPRGLITGGLPPYAETRNYVSSIMNLVTQPSELIMRTGLTSSRGHEKSLSSETPILISDKSGITQSLRTHSKSNPNSSFIEVQ
ncbi:MAG TPA: hypothetical protein VE863_17220, partial [Pyrinomonadaceae bacterium]|nr:hypothetical protein [Pyrinomonadaceae bacterium]